jgi:Queuosine biosynthesis protein QueC
VEQTFCVRCVLSGNVPRTVLNDDGVCNVCEEYAANKLTYDSYFRTEDDLGRLIKSANEAIVSEFDCLLLYSGGKDSTYVLYRLVELGYRVLSITFDNGYIPSACFDNIREVCLDVGVENIVARVDKNKMDEVFAESLRRNGTVCSGCFRGLTAKSTEVAISRKIPIIITGLSRGQIYDTKVHQLMKGGITKPEQIDDYLREFRRQYHSVEDRIGSLINDQVMKFKSNFERTHFIDFYRYSSVTKNEISNLISTRASFWRKPGHVGGCSTNCMINDVGIQVHTKTRGYHNYAIPLAWDVRFGHITRDEALQQLQSKLDTGKIERLLQIVGYK